MHKKSLAVLGTHVPLRQVTRCFNTFPASASRQLPFICKWIRIYIYISAMHMYVCMYKVCCAQLLFCTHTALEIISLQFLAVSIRQWDLAWINCDCRLWQIACFPLFFIRLKLQITVCPNSITISFLCHRFGCSVWEHFGLLYRDLLKDVHSWEGHPCQEFRVSLTLIFYLIWKYVWKGEHIYFISIPANTLSPVRLHYLNNKDVPKGKIIWWQFISTDHSSNMTNIILLKITLRVSLYIRQRKNLFFWQENHIVSEIFSSTEGDYMAGAICQDGNTISTLILSGFIFASFSF